MDGIFDSEISEFDRRLYIFKNQIKEGEEHIYYQRPKYLYWLEGTEDQKREYLKKLKKIVVDEERSLKQLKEADAQVRNDLRRYPGVIFANGYECMRCRSSHPSDRRNVFPKTYSATYEIHNWAHTGK